MHIETAIQLIEARNLPAGREMLEQLLEQDECNEQAWFWLSKAVDDIESHIICLENVLALNPNNAQAYNRLKELDAFPEQKQVGIKPIPSLSKPVTDDARELRAQLDELEHRYRLLETLSINIISEVRTPIGAIIGFSELLLKGIDGDLNKNQLECLTIIKDSAKTVRSMVDQFFDVQRVLFGELYLNVEEVDLEKLLEPLKPAELSLAIPPGIPKIWVDPHQVSQVFKALFSGEVLRWRQDEACLQVNYDDEWVNFKLVSAANASYLHSEEYPDPMVFYAQVVIEEHGGACRWERSTEGVEVRFSLPIRRNQPSD